MKEKTIKEITSLIMLQAKEKGFGITPEEIDFPRKIASLHSEVTEVYDAYRKKGIKRTDLIGKELCDVIQRTLHLCGVFKIDVEKEILKKIKINSKRSWN